MSRNSPPHPGPPVLARRSTDEYAPPPDSARARRALDQALHDAPAWAKRAGRKLGCYWASRQGTAAGLLALNDAFACDYYRVPREAALDPAVAAEALAGDELVIDVQTHYVAGRAEHAWTRTLLDLYRALQPSWWKGLEGWEAYSLAEYLRCIYLESETAVAVLTSAPGLEESRMLWNAELAGTRDLFDRLGGEGRLLNHCVVHPDVPGELDTMARERDTHHPAGWKVYTIGHPSGDGFVPSSSWWLDGETVGVPFLERVRALGGPLVCVHKGISALVPTGSPRDVGPAAAGFPDLRFLIYHSGYEIPVAEGPEEGPYTEAPQNVGTNRLVKSLHDAKIPPGSNVYAELGSTWFCLIRRPDEAAHVLGKLLRAVGEDNVLWGSDSIWYGATQPAIDAFRAFQIPVELRERYGYPELTPAIKEKILGRNAARVYGIDLEATRERIRNDDLAGIREALNEFDATGTPRSAV